MVALLYTSSTTAPSPPHSRPLRPMADSEALRDYLPAFEGERGSDHFLTYYSIAPDKTLRTRRYTREQFYSLALRAASVLAEVGLTAGQMHTHFFSGNTVGDLAFRLGAVMMGTVPITINWQADTPERVVHKVKTTGSRLVLTDGETPADVVAKVRAECSCVERVFDVSELSSHPVTFDVSSKFCTQLPVSAESTRIVIFTSGTTGDPKGVRLSYRSYRCNRHTFESFLQAGDGKKLVGVVVNPMHHTNSTSITDWALRKPRAELHLLQRRAPHRRAPPSTHTTAHPPPRLHRYTTSYWSVLARAGTRLPIDALVDETELTAAIEDRHKPPPDAGGGGAAAGYSSGLDVVVVAPLVSRHFDFLDGLLSSGTLPLPAASLKAAMSRSILLLGSAPVGPTTVERLQKYAGKLPTVRFGSTETCLQASRERPPHSQPSPPPPLPPRRQVMGTPLYLSESERLDAFAAGWAHKYGGEPQVGYYIGRPHPPFTECRVVRSVEAGADGYMVDSDEGEPGQLITRGENIMTGYVGNEASTAKAIHDGGWCAPLSIL